MRSLCRVSWAIAAVVAALLLLSIAPAAAQKRVALLIGVDRYAKLEARFQLQKAVNDANATAALLRKLGFSAEVLSNPDLEQIIEKVEALAQTVRPGDTVFLFFSGHGLSPEGSNLLLPSDFPDIGRGGPGMREIARRGAIAESALVAQFRDRLTDKNTGQFNGLVIAVIDACRNNPFARTNADFRRAIGVAPTFQHQPSVGVFSIYSAGADQLALDRLSNADLSPTSVFTRIFLSELQKPGIALSEVVTSARVEVSRLAATYRDPETGQPHIQTPAYYDQTQGGPIFLAGPPAGNTQPSLPPVIAQKPPVVVPPTVTAAGQPRYRVVDVRKDDFLNVRSEGHVGAPSLHRLPPNTQNITVIAKPGLWWRIKAGEVEGWVLSRFLQEMSGAPAKATEQAHEGYAYQYSNETAYTEADASSCARACRSSPNCNALTFFKSRKLCRLMTRMDALLEANPDAVSIYMAKNVQ